MNLRDQAIAAILCLAFWLWIILCLMEIFA